LRKELFQKLREQIFARQRQLGVVPVDAELTPRPKEILAWDSLSANQKRLYARQMEVYAGFAEHTDEQVGRLVDALQEMGVTDSTLFIYIIGDNGASAEGGPEGAYNEMMALNGIINTAEINMPHLDNWGDPSTFPHYAIGWAWAGDTPFQWTKQIASHYGGTTNGVVVHWPTRIKAKGEIRSQFTHVTDIAPTVLEATGLPFPKSVNGAIFIFFDPPGYLSKVCTVGPKENSSVLPIATPSAFAQCRSIRTGSVSRPCSNSQAFSGESDGPNVRMISMRAFIV
jgi:arylsulfatase